MKIIDYVISFEDGVYLVMKIYENRQWDTYATFEDAFLALDCMHDRLGTI